MTAHVVPRAKPVVPTEDEEKVTNESRWDGEEESRTTVHEGDVAEKIRALNDWLKSFAASQNITYLDYYSAMAGPDGGMKPGISIDGVHPNAAGYAIMEPLAEKARPLYEMLAAHKLRPDAETEE